MSSYENPLERVHNARVLLEEANSVDEIKRLVDDTTEQLRLYGREADDLQEINRAAAEIKLRGKRRVGQILAKVPRVEAGRPGNSPDHPANSPTPLQAAIREMGLSRGAAHDREQLAAIPDETFEAGLRRARELGKMPTEDEVSKGEQAWLDSLPSPEKTPAERAFDSLNRWSWFVNKCTPEEFADLAIEYPNMAPTRIAEYRAIAAFMTSAADLADARLANPIQVIEGGRRRHA
jgi:hypothetical protein